LEPAEPSGARTSLESLRALAASLLGLVATRAELAVVELREEAERRKDMAVLAAVAGVFITLAALLFALFIVVLFWDSHRVLAAAGVTLAYLGVGVVALMRLNRRRRESPPPFEATLAELAQDVAALRGRHE
jgi:uncharacterized membrane protein YqjE